MRREIKEIGTALLDLAMPRLCVVCGGRLLLHERHICTACLADMPLTRFWNQSRNAMADRLNALIEGAEPYAYACALFFYDGEHPYHHITPQLKYYRNIEMGRFFSAMLARRLSEAVEFADVDVVVPVPLHPIRRWKRGYNQAEIIAAEIARVLPSAPALRTDLIRRVHYTRSQTTLSGGAKTANVSAAFAPGRGKMPQPRHILIVDDVFTSGATLNACRLVLREIFPLQVRISVATLAFVNT